MVCAARRDVGGELEDDEKGGVLMRDGASEGDRGLTGKTDGCGDCGMVDPRVLLKEGEKEGDRDSRRDGFKDPR